MTAGASYQSPCLFERRHIVDSFECQSIEQTTWLRDHARQAASMGTARVWVVTKPGKDEVVAYYAWAMGSIAAKDAPPRLLQGAGGYPQPVLLLARLGVDLNHEGNGLGYGLLQDVMFRTATLAETAGCRGLLVHAESEEARSFYLHHIPEFMTSPTDPLHLVLLMKDIKRTLGAV